MPGADDRDRSAKGILHPEGMRAARDLAVGVVHEINNVLGIVIGNAHLALKNVTDPESVERYVAEIRQAAEEGRDITRQLSSLSGEEPAHTRVVSLNDLAFQLTKSQRKPVNVAPCDPEPKVRLDLWLAQDALSSAVRYMASATSVTRLDVATRIFGDAAMLVLEDDGPTPTPAELANLFSPFAKVGHRPKQGLDLTKLAYLAERAGGHVVASGNDPTGLRLALTLPMV